MTLLRAINLTTAVLITFGLADSQAGGPSPTCGLTIEINALRAGSPTVTVNETKNVTAKARILKGTAPKGTTIDTTLRIDAVDGSTVINTFSSSPHTLVIGRGGTGDTFPMNITQCQSGSIDFVAKFFGNAANGAPCEAEKTINRTCK